GEHSRDGILLGSKFGPGAESELGNCLTICAALTYNRRRSRLLSSSLRNSKWRISISTRRPRFWVMHACSIRNRPCSIESICSSRKRSISRRDLRRRRQHLNKSHIPLHH